jgi:tryptophanyl-tRNA synthetase
MLSDQMKSLTEAIEASYEEREAALSQLKQETHETLQRFHQEHEEMAKALRSELSSYRESVSQAVHELMSEYATDRRQAHQYWVNMTKAMKAKRGR